MQQARLRSGIRFDLERVVVLPGDVQARGYAHQTSRAVSLALIAGGFVLGRIPFLSDLLACWIQGHSREIALGRRDHAEAPVFADDGNPVAGEIDGSDGFGRLGRPGRRSSRKLREQSGRNGQDS